MACCLTHMHDLIWDFCSSDQRFARELVYSSHPASFRFHLTMDTLAFGYILPTTGRIRDFNPLETCAARRTSKKKERAHRPSLSRLSVCHLPMCATTCSKHTGCRQSEGSPPLVSSSWQLFLKLFSSSSLYQLPAGFLPKADTFFLNCYCCQTSSEVL